MLHITLYNSQKGIYRIMICTSVTYDLVLVIKMCVVEVKSIIAQNVIWYELCARIRLCHV